MRRGVRVAPGVADRLVAARLSVPPGEPVALGDERMAQVRRDGLEVRLARPLELVGPEAVDRGEDPLVRPLVVVHQPAQLSRIGHGRPPFPRAA